MMKASVIMFIEVFQSRTQNEDTVCFVLDNKTLLKNNISCFVYGRIVKHGYFP